MFCRFLLYLAGALSTRGYCPYVVLLPVCKPRILLLIAPGEVNHLLMHTPTTIKLSCTDYFLQNTAYYFKLTRISGRITIAAASDITGLCEKTIWECEKADQKEGCTDTMIKFAKAYGIMHLRTLYTNAPSRQDWEELNAKGIELGKELRCKKIPKPGSGLAAKPYDEKWKQWGDEVMARFNKRVGE